jgi:hypothetical protein
LSKPRESIGEVGVEIGRPSELLNCRANAHRPALGESDYTLEVGIVCRSVRGSPRGESGFIARGNMYAESSGNRAADILLKLEEVSKLTIVRLLPDDVSVRGIDELRRYARAVAEFTQAAIHHMSHPQKICDPSHV